jgi:hypothetical protein
VRTELDLRERVARAEGPVRRRKVARLQDGSEKVQGRRREASARDSRAASSSSTSSTSPSTHPSTGSVWLLPAPLCRPGREDKPALWPTSRARGMRSPSPVVAVASLATSAASAALDSASWRALIIPATPPPCQPVSPSVAVPAGCWPIPEAREECRRTDRACRHGVGVLAARASPPRTGASKEGEAARECLQRGRRLGSG